MKTVCLHKKVLSLLAFIALFIVSCAGPVSDPSQSGSSSDGGGVTPVPTLQVPPHRSYRLYDVWFDATSLYNRSFFNQAKQALSNWIEEACGVPNSDGFDVDINFITSNSFALSSDSFTIRCPKIGVPPLLPTLTPTPTPSSNPYDQAAQSTVEATNQQVLNDYNAKMAAFMKVVTNAKTEVSQGTNKLRQIEPAIDGNADIYGMIKRASYRFENAPGEHKLFIVSSLVNTTEVNYTNTSPLYGASVKLLWWTCQDVSSCSANIDYWYDYFKTNGASGDPLRYDPDRSSSLTNPFA